MLKRAPQTRGLEIAGTLAAAGISPGQWMIRDVARKDLITGANLAARSLRRDREMPAARALTPGLDFMVAMEWHERVPEIGDAP